jgi:hypothetical protein
VVALAQWNGYGVDLAISGGKPIIMSEFNSASCGGIPGISDTFGAALWTIDYALQLAVAGYSAAYIHIREAGISYNLFDPPTPPGAPGPWTTNPNWYAMLVVPEILQNPNGTKIVDLDIANSTWNPNATLAGYATIDASTSHVHRLAIFNFANDSATQEIQLPSSILTNSTSPANITVKYLVAPNALEKWNISWDDQTFNSVVDGNAIPGLSVATPAATNQLDCSGPDGCSISVHGPGLAVVYIGATEEVGTVNNTTAPSSKGDNNRSSNAHKQWDISYLWISLVVACEVLLL